jgi:hypothetical protein
MSTQTFRTLWKFLKGKFVFSLAHLFVLYNLNINQKLKHKGISENMGKNKKSKAVLVAVLILLAIGYFIRERFPDAAGFMRQVAGSLLGL